MSLMPTEMSCRQAFDLAWGCQSPVGQFRNIYRYGEMRACSEQWDDFWFCMRTKGWSGETKKQMIRQHYRNKELRKYGPGKPSSEDVWESRDRKLTKEEAFNVQYQDPDWSDEEFNRMEMERRRRIREEMGFYGDRKPQQ